MGKRTIVLSESELINVIKNIISEQTRIVTDHDRAYDYKMDGDKFYFRGKGKYAEKYPDWTLAKTEKGINAIRTKVFNLRPMSNLEPIEPIEPQQGSIIPIPTPPSLPDSSSESKLSKNDLIVAATIWGEARGEGERGMIAVANVIKNRAKSGGITPKEVVLKPKQFSVWNNTDVDSVLKSIESSYKKNPTSKDSKMWDLSKNITTEYVKNDGNDITKGSEYYHTLSVNPSWASKLDYVATIGNHKFYKKKAVTKPSTNTEVAKTKNTSGTPKNIIIGDSQTPFIDNASAKASRIGEQGSEDTLWKGGMGLSWLKTAVGNYPVSPDVNSVTINIGTNGGFNPNDDVEGLVSVVRKKFPNAKILAVQGSWKWKVKKGGNQNVTQEMVDRYYDMFRNAGVTVLDTAIGKVDNPHGNIPIYKKIGAELDSLL